MLLVNKLLIVFINFFWIDFFSSENYCIVSVTFYPFVIHSLEHNNYVTPNTVY